MRTQRHVWPRKSQARRHLTLREVRAIWPDRTVALPSLWLIPVGSENACCRHLRTHRCKFHSSRLASAHPSAYLFHGSHVPIDEPSVRMLRHDVQRIVVIFHFWRKHFSIIHFLLDPKHADTQMPKLAVTVSANSDDRCRRIDVHLAAPFEMPITSQL